jgi:hypothetical protein
MYRQEHGLANNNHKVVTGPIYENASPRPSTRPCLTIQATPRGGAESDFVAHPSPEGWSPAGEEVQLVGRPAGTGPGGEAGTRFLPTCGSDEGSLTVCRQLRCPVDVRTWRFSGG